MADHGWAMGLDARLVRTKVGVPADVCALDDRTQFHAYADQRHSRPSSIDCLPPIAICKLQIANCKSDDSAIGNRKSAIDNPVHSHFFPIHSRSTFSAGLSLGV
jgi:hypothetical protein